MTQENKTAQELALEAARRLANGSINKHMYGMKLSLIQKDLDTVIQALTPPSDDAVREALEVMSVAWERYYDDDSFYEAQVGNALKVVKQALQSRAVQEGEVAHDTNVSSTEQQEVMEMWDKLDHVWRWIERAYFDKDLSVDSCLNVLVHSPYAPWNVNREKWDTGHKKYDAEIDKTIAETHPSIADAVDVEAVRQSIRESLVALNEVGACCDAAIKTENGKMFLSSVIVNNLVQENLLNLTQKPDDGMVSEWRDFVLEDVPVNQRVLVEMDNGDIAFATKKIFVKDAVMSCEGYQGNWKVERFCFIPPLPPPPAQHLTEEDNGNK